MPSIKPILVTGSHRSGTTWVGRILSAADNVVYIHEPFNITQYSGVFSLPSEFWFTYVSTGNEALVREYMSKVIGLEYELFRHVKQENRIADFLRVLKSYSTYWYRRKFTHPRVLLKDPIALFSAEWLCDTYDLDVVVLIRHPAAFISSLKRLEWRHPFDHFLKQTELMEDYLEPFRYQIIECVEKPRDIISQGIVLWNIFHYIIAKFQDGRANWTFIRHEDISREPFNEFRRLFDKLGLSFSEKIQRIIACSTSASNPSGASDKSFDQLMLDSEQNIWNWKKRLTEDEINRIKNGVEPLASSFYCEADWGSL